MRHWIRWSCAAAGLTWTNYMSRGTKHEKRNWSWSRIMTRCYYGSILPVTQVTRCIVKPLSENCRESWEIGQIAEWMTKQVGLRRFRVTESASSSHLDLPCFIPKQTMCSKSICIFPLGLFVFTLHYWKAGQSSLCSCWGYVPHAHACRSYSAMKRHQ